MHLVSISVGRPRDVTFHGRPVRTSIWKSAVQGPVGVRTLNIDGDEQSDLSVHGGPDKAVYAYPSEHYEYWRRELPGAELPWGAFGENFTTAGLLEADLAIGDRLRAGSAEFQVTQPRVPCFKLAVRFGRGDMVKRFLKSRRSGFYLAVLREGQVAAGDPVHVIERDDHHVTVADMAALYARETADRDLVRRAVEVPALPEIWKEQLRTLL